MMAKPSTRERQLAGEIKSMMALAREAERRGSYGPAVQARSRVSSLRSELARLREERVAEALADPLERVSRLRRLATEAGSYTAAGALAKLEAELVAARELAAQATGEDFQDATDEEILGVITAAILSLPDVLVLQLRDACQDRLDGKKLRAL